MENNLNISLGNYIQEFLDDRKHFSRYSSFDYCYNYFYNFYLSNKNEIDNFKIKTLDFKTGKNTNIYYTKAKIIDMYGFILGLKK